MELVGCTIVALNYYPVAQVIAKSFREHHPEAYFAVLVVHQVQAGADEGCERFGVIDSMTLASPHDEALRMAAIYDVMEMCTAVKPWMLQRLLDVGAHVVIYLNPDIQVYGRLDKAIGRAFDVGIVLTPYVTRPMPGDGMGKSEYDVLLSSIYNLGFIAVPPDVGEFLSWQERLRRESIVDSANMRFLDQRSGWGRVTLLAGRCLTRTVVANKASIKVSPPSSLGTGV